MDGSIPPQPTARGIIGEAVSTPGYPNGGVPQGTLSGPKNVLVHINDLHTPCPLYKYVDDCTVFDIICSHTRVSMLQDSVDIVAIGLQIMIDALMRAKLKR